MGSCWMEHRRDIKMDWDAITLIRTNVKKLAKSVTLEIQDLYPTRTTEFKKCTRDMSYVIQALSTSIQANNTLAIDHIIKMFYLNGILRLKSVNVEIHAYKILEEKIISMFNEKSISELSKSIVINCLTLLKDALENGYIEPNSEWGNRRNYKLYDPTFKVPVDFQYRIEAILENSPLQASGHNKFDMLKIQDGDLEIREFLVKNYFKNPKFGTFEAAIVTSPVIYLCLANSNDTLKEVEQIFPKDQAISVHGGAVLHECLSHGYDFSFIGCTVEDPSEKSKKQWIEMVENRWNYSPSEEWPWPLLAMCVGKGVDYDPAAPISKTYTFLDGSTGTYNLTFEPTSPNRKSNNLYV